LTIKIREIEQKKRENNAVHKNAEEWNKKKWWERGRK
jgi:hypothetical protein